MDNELINQRLMDTWRHFPTLREFRIYLIESAMKNADGNLCIAATLLGLEKQTLNKLFQSLNMRQMTSIKQGAPMPEQPCNYKICKKIFEDAKLIADVKLSSDMSTGSNNKNWVPNHPITQTN